jgi:hypothetical protein
VLNSRARKSTQHSTTVQKQKQQQHNHRDLLLYTAHSFFRGHSFLALSRSPRKQYSVPRRGPVPMSVLFLRVALFLQLFFLNGLLLVQGSTTIIADKGLLSTEKNQPPITTTTTVREDDNETTTDSATTTTVTVTANTTSTNVNNNNNNNNNKNDNTTKVEEENPCNLYLAPSSIPNGGYGVFTARSLNKGDIILENDGPDILGVDPNQFEGPHTKLLDHVWWSWEGGMSDTMAMDSLGGATDFQIMLGALPNFHTFLSNIHHAVPDFVYDDRMADRTKDPGAGAFSYYKGKIFSAGRNIAAGEELFLHYGEDWFDDGSSDWDFVPRRADFERDGARLEQLAKELKQQQGIKDKLVCNGQGQLQSMTPDGTYSQMDCIVP